MQMQNVTKTAGFKG